MSLALGASFGSAWADATQDLYRAVHANDLRAVKASLAAGADPTFRDRDGLTPAMLADELGHGVISRFLHEAAPTAKDEPAEDAADIGFLERLLSRATGRRQAETVKVSIPIAAAPDKARKKSTASDKTGEKAIATAPPDKARDDLPAPHATAEAPAPGAIAATRSEPPISPEKPDTSASGNAKPEPPPSVSQTTAARVAPEAPKAPAAAPRPERRVTKAGPRFALPLPPRKPDVPAPKAVATDMPNDPFDPAIAPPGSVMAAIENVPAPIASAEPAKTDTVPPTVEAAETAAEPQMPIAAATPAKASGPSDHKVANAFDRFLGSLFGGNAAPEPNSTPAAPERAATVEPAATPEQARAAAPPDTRQSSAEPNAFDRFLRRLFSFGGDDAASAPEPARQTDTASSAPPPPVAVQKSAAVVADPATGGPNAFDLLLRRIFTATPASAMAESDKPAPAETATMETAAAEPAAALPSAAPAANPVSAPAAKTDNADALSRFLRGVFRDIAAKNVHAEPPRAEKPPAPPIEIAEASGPVASDRPVVEPPTPALIPVPAAPPAFAVSASGVRKAPAANARAMFGTPPEAAPSTIVAENVIRPMIANPSAPSVVPAERIVELAARPQPDAAVPPRPAPFKPVRRPPLSGVTLSLGQTATIGRPWPAKNLPPYSCVAKKAWNAGFCVEPIDWPAVALPIFDVNAPLYRGAMAVTRYEGGVARQYHTVFPAAMFGAVVAYFESNLGPATEEDLKAMAMPGRKPLDNPIRRWVSEDPATGRKTAIEVRGFDNLRNFIPDSEYGVARLYDEGAGAVFEFLGTAELLLMRIKQTSAAFPTLKTDPATR